MGGQSNYGTASTRPGENLWDMGWKQNWRNVMGNKCEYAAIELLLNGQRMVAKNLLKINVSNVAEKVTGQRIVALIVKNDVGVGVQEEAEVTFL
ncbi:12212_t:CDS:2 [Acaulospora colombiana]|uniref:12212_t:CDS:1 n=1 Tax=Acaulospora colombiana TaxID=27376 RepID=A0ACA9KZN5_9GLOM|nr:12212_t:CDS:2 [Acaulospora colombiana]